MKVVILVPAVAAGASGSVAGAPGSSRCSGRWRFLLFFDGCPRMPLLGGGRWGQPLSGFLAVNRCLSLSQGLPSLYMDKYSCPRLAQGVRAHLHSFSSVKWGGAKDQAELWFVGCMWPVQVMDTSVRFVMSLCSHGWARIQEL